MVQEKEVVVVTWEVMREAASKLALTCGIKTIIDSMTAVTFPGWESGHNYPTYCTVYDQSDEHHKQVPDSHLYRYNSDDLCADPYKEDDKVDGGDDQDEINVSERTNALEDSSQ